MNLRKRNAFTLIELVAVLVIMAIIALTVTPLVMSIIRKAKVSADKRSVDAYGRSIELAIAGYLMDTGSFPTSIDQLTIEYSGDEVVCTTTNLNADSSVYLAGCTVAGRSIGDYTYGSDKTSLDTAYNAYEIGDIIQYNGVQYRVIKDSSASESSVTLLKAEPLTVAEVNQYGGVETANNHVNMYNALSSDSYYQRAYDSNGYGGMAYYTGIDCGYANGDIVETGCTTDYAQSEVKYVVDAWKTAKAPDATEARLITYDELMDNLGYDMATLNVSYWQVNTEYTPNWVYSSDYSYWTMSSYNDSTLDIWWVSSNSLDNSYHVSYSFHVVRPVIVLPKSAL